MNWTMPTVGTLLALAALMLAAHAGEPSQVQEAPSVAPPASGVATRTGHAFRRGVDSAASATGRGLDSAGRGVKKGVEVGADAVKTTGERTAVGVKRGVRRVEGWVGAGSGPRNPKTEVPVEDKSEQAK